MPALLTAEAAAQSPVLISSDPAGVPSQTTCGVGQVSSSFDGRWVAFDSDAPNLSPNVHRQVFLKDLTTWGLEYVSLSSAGTPGNSSSFTARVSWDGRYVAFLSRATNLIAGDTNGVTDVYLRDRWTGQTTRENLGQGGVQLNDDSLLSDLSSDGRFVLFSSAATNVLPGLVGGQLQHYLRDRLTGAILAVEITASGVPTNGDSYFGSVSADGRYVVFSSDATNLVPGDVNGFSDVFLRDFLTGTLIRLSQNAASQGGDGDSTLPGISDDGRFVIFSTAATNLVVPDLNGSESDVLGYDLATGALERVSVASGGQQPDARSFSFGLSWMGATWPSRAGAPT